MDRKIKGSSPTSSRDLFLFWELIFWELTYWEVDILGVDISGVDILGVDILRLTYSALSQKLSRRFSFMSFGGDVKLSVPGNPLKLA